MNLTGDDLILFWRLTAELARHWNLREDLVRLLDLCATDRGLQTVADIGVVDRGLLELTYREGGVLITRDERSLAVRAWAQGIDCRLVKQFVTQW